MQSISATKQNTSVPKVFAGLSGGVDSAVAAALLKKQGNDVTGVFIRIVVPEYPCTAGQDKLDAMRAAAHLRIPFLEVDLSKEYQKKVFEISILEFKKGKTPNPDILCNREIKFGLFYDWCRARGADFVAMGHYARRAKSTDFGYGDFLAKKSPEVASPPLGKPPPSVILLSGIDPDKDQSYFLALVPETTLRRTLFPVGYLTKRKVRAFAKKFGLPNAERPDSQGLCFLGPISIGDMLSRELLPSPGKVLNEDGEVIGMHKGAALYTLGQRHGFGAPSSVPLYVIAKNMEKNTITVSPNKFPKKATKTEIILSEMNWIGPVYDGQCFARYRYKQTLIPAELHKNKVTLHEPHYVPLGQILVLYKGDALSQSSSRRRLGMRCLGGGVIDSVKII